MNAIDRLFIIIIIIIISVKENHYYEIYFPSAKSHNVRFIKNERNTHTIKNVISCFSMLNFFCSNHSNFYLTIDFFFHFITIFSTCLCTHTHTHKHVHRSLMSEKKFSCLKKIFLFPIWIKNFCSIFFISFVRFDSII